MTQPPRRRLAIHGALGLLVGFAAALVTIAAVEQFSERGVREPLRLGGLDFEGFCARDDGMTALLLASDPHGWRCAGTLTGVRGGYPIDPSEVCHWQHGESAYAVLAEPADVDGWVCVRD